MKNWILIFISVASVSMTNQLNAQSHRTVEVTVSDTVFRKTNKIIYVMFLDTNYYNFEENEEYYDEEEYYEQYLEEEYEYEQEESRKKRRRNKDSYSGEELQYIPPIVIEEEIIEEVEIEEFHYLKKADLMHLLDSAKFNYEVIDHDNYQILDETKPIYFRLILNNEEELKRMHSTFAGHNEINGTVKEIEYESIESMMPTVYKDLYAKAQKEATILAKLSGLTLDKISKVYEHQTEFGDYLDSYEKLMKSYSGRGTEPIDFYGKEEIVERTFVFDVK